MPSMKLKSTAQDAPASPLTPLSPHKSGLLYGSCFDEGLGAKHTFTSSGSEEKVHSTRMENISNAAGNAASKSVGAVGVNVYRMKRWFGRKVNMASNKANKAAVTSRVQAAIGKYDTVE